jgi:tetratricopeptide (TPR) repeat protein
MENESMPDLLDSRSPRCGTRDRPDNAFSVDSSLRERARFRPNSGGTARVVGVLVLAAFAIGGGPQAPGSDATAHYQRGLALFRQAIKLRPGLSSAHQGLGVAPDFQAKRQEALAEFREASRLEPDDAIIHNSLALGLAMPPDRPRREYEEALAHAKRAVELGSQRGNRYVTLALAEYRLGHWNESLKASERAMALDRDDGSSRFLAAMAHWQKGEKADARSWFEKGAVWMRETHEKHPFLIQLWRESAALLGQSVPDAPTDRKTKSGGSATPGTATRPR